MSFCFLVAVPLLAADCKLDTHFTARVSGEIEVQPVGPNIVRVHIVPSDRSSPRTPVMDPAFRPAEIAELHCDRMAFASPEMSVALLTRGSGELEVNDAAGHRVVTFKNMGGEASGGHVSMIHDEREELYGMRGLERMDTGAGILRTGGATVLLGNQGDGGAPFFFTRTFGVLIDSDGGNFETRDEIVKFHRSSRPDIEFFVIVGKPMQTMEGLALLTGKAPMPPRWTLGFMNSQWGSTEAEIKDLTKTYREKNIPISGFILDFDWKAWGEDDYGEWRWNSTSGPGNPFPDKFPDGASGQFAADLLQSGVHLAGILKPRILVNNTDGKPTQASLYATEHDFWYRGQTRGNDYFTHRLAGDIDFAKPEARAWYWQHLVPSFNAGMKAWWNDEADYPASMNHDNFQFLNMARALYDGQRSSSDERVWSINRAYYLGAQRYGFALWSGDINSGFRSMEYQRRRMIAAINTGEPHWSMDTGGFDGHPTPENYARWMEFAAFVPIYRVHGGFNEKRQPWVYGPVAEAAAKRAMRLRYDLMPYLYSNERITTETGIGIVRPLFWAFPDDPNTANETRSWMFGDALLVSPVVEHGATSHALYLPAGMWRNYWSGEAVVGGKEITVPADAATWQDIPLFVREGSIVASQPAETGNEVSPRVPLVLDVFPSPAREADFSVYDDDGHTYAYEKGRYFEQHVAAVQHGNAVEVTLTTPKGTLNTAIPSYILRVHSTASTLAAGPKTMRRFSSDAEFSSSNGQGWVASHDRFGPVLLIRLASGGSEKLTLR